MELAFQIPSLMEIIRIVFVSTIVSLGSFFIIRLGGKKSVSQMTLPQTVIMLALGSLIVQPLSESKSIIGTFISVFIFILVMILLEAITIVNEKAEEIIDSVPIVLILDGVILKDNLKKSRMSYDQLEAMLREKGIASFDELRTCTLEISGQIGYEKNKNYNPNSKNIFDEVRQGKHNFKIDEKLD